MKMMNGMIIFDTTARLVKRYRAIYISFLLYKGVKVMGKLEDAEKAIQELLKEPMYHQLQAIHILRDFIQELKESPKLSGYRLYKYIDGVKYWSRGGIDWSPRVNDGKLWKQYGHLKAHLTQNYNHRGFDGLTVEIIPLVEKGNKIQQTMGEVVEMNAQAFYDTYNKKGAK